MWSVSMASVINCPCAHDSYIYFSSCPHPLSPRSIYPTAYLTLHLDDSSKAPQTQHMWNWTHEHLSKISFSSRDRLLSYHLGSLTLFSPLLPSPIYFITEPRHFLLPKHFSNLSTSTTTVLSKLSGLLYTVVKITHRHLRFSCIFSDTPFLHVAEYYSIVWICRSLFICGRTFGCF